MDYARNRYAYENNVLPRYVYIDHENIPRDIFYIIKAYGNSGLSLPVIEVSKFLGIQKKDIQPNKFRPDLPMQLQSDDTPETIPNMINVEVKNIVYSILTLNKLDHMFLDLNLLPALSFALFQKRTRLGPKYKQTKDEYLRKKLIKQEDSLFLYFKHEKRRLLIESTGYLTYCNFYGFDDDSDRLDTLYTLIPQEIIVTISKDHTSAIFSPVKEIPPGDKRVIVALLTFDEDTLKYIFLNENENVVDPSKRVIFWLGETKKLLSISIQRGKLEFGTNDISPFMKYHHIEYAQRILSLLINNYEVKQQNIVGIFAEYGIHFESSNVATKAKKALESDLPTNYKSICVSHRQPTIVTEEEIQQLALEEHRVLSYPVFPKQNDNVRFYACIGRAEAEGYKYPGLKETKKGSGIFVPCCFKDNQYTKKGAKLNQVLSGSSSVGYTTKDLNEDKTLGKNSEGRIPPYLAYIAQSGSIRRGAGNLADVIGYIGYKENLSIPISFKNILKDLSPENFEKYMSLFSYCIGIDIILAIKTYKYDTVFIKIKKIDEGSNRPIKCILIETNLGYEFIIDSTTRLPSLGIKLLEYIRFYQDAIRSEKREISLL